MNIVKVLLVLPLFLFFLVFPSNSQAAVLFQDSFTNSDNTSISSHNFHYTELGGSGPAATIQSNRLNGGRNFRYDNSFNSTTDQCISFDIITDLSQTQQLWNMYGRLNFSNFSHTEARFYIYSDGSGTISFGNFDSSIGWSPHEDIIHSFPTGFFDDNSSYNAKFCIAGSDATFYVDETQYGSHTVLSSIDQGTFGFAMSSGTSYNGAATLDNLMFTTDVPTPPTSLPFQDSFTNSSGTSINSHNINYSDIGGSGPAGTIQSNRLLAGRGFRFDDNSFTNLTDQCLGFDMITDLSKDLELWNIYLRVNPATFDHTEARFYIYPDGSGSITYGNFDHSTGWDPHEVSLQDFPAGYFNDNTSYNAKFCAVGNIGTIYLNQTSYGSFNILNSIAEGTFGFGMASGINFDGSVLIDNLVFNEPSTNFPPTVVTISPSSSLIQANSPISASANFTDQNSSDTHTATWNWGDGNTTSGTVSESNGSGSVSGSHTYTNAGVYTITLTVSDDNNSSASTTYQYIVVYDPSAGFLTASGKYNSQAGWYMPNTSAAGDFKFGIQAKYNNNSTPTGDTKLRFQAENLNFDANTYQWLVVSGAKATLKGTGTLNGVSNHTFLISAIDGNQTNGQNLIRVQIKDASNNVVYDTQSGDADTADPTTPISNGNIKIH